MITPYGKNFCYVPLEKIEAQRGEHTRVMSGARIQTPAV